MSGIDGHADHPALAPPPPPRPRPDVLEQADDPIAAPPPAHGWHPAQPPLTPQPPLRGQARHPPDHLRRFPPRLPACDHPQAWLLLATSGRKQRAASIPSGQRRRRQRAPRGDHDRLRIAAFRLGRPPEPLPGLAATPPGGPHGGDLAPPRRRERPRAELCPQLAPPRTRADGGHHRLGPSQEPRASGGWATAARQPATQARPARSPPPPLPFQLAPGGVQRRHRPGFPAAPCGGEDCPGGAGAEAPRLPPRLAPVAAHPGPLTALGLGPKGPWGDRGLPPPPLPVARRAGSRPLTRERGRTDTVAWGPRVSRTRGPGARHGRRLGAALAPQGALDGPIPFHADMAV